MPYITREDGERFIIPSYRDTISAKKTSLLQKEIALLTANYGEYITLQRKTTSAYEIALSPDSGYLLGECVWHYFKRPYDMIYCEAIPNTFEAILVIVKSGTVYLDGSFPVDSIPEELVVFKTQQNNFSIYTYGDVPISQVPEDGKFSFEAASVKSFTELDTPVFPTLPGVKVFQLQLADVVLKSYGIGVLPTKQLIIAFVVLGIIYMGYAYFTTHKKELPITFSGVVANPYQGFLDDLTSPDPAKQLEGVSKATDLLYTVPGWQPVAIEYNPTFPATVRAELLSDGARLQILKDWAYKNNATLEINSTGIFVTIILPTAKRTAPTTINNMQDVLVTLIDRMSYVIPGNTLTLSSIVDKRQYQEANLVINFADLAPAVVNLIGNYIQGLPLVLNKFSIKLEDGDMSGSITLKAVGN